MRRQCDRLRLAARDYRPARESHNCTDDAHNYAVPTDAPLSAH